MSSLAGKACPPGLLPARSRRILRVRSFSAILGFDTVAVRLISNRIHLFRVFGGISGIAIATTWVCGRLGAVLGFHVHFVMYSPRHGRWGQGCSVSRVQGIRFSTNSFKGSEACSRAPLTVLISRSRSVEAPGPFAHSSIYSGRADPRIVTGALTQTRTADTKRTVANSRRPCLWLLIPPRSPRPVVNRGWRNRDLIVARLRLMLAGVRRIGIGLSHGCNGVQSTRSKTRPQKSDALKSLGFWCGKVGEALKRQN